MQIKPFALERYFAKYEFTTPHLLSSSDCEPYRLSELLALADRESESLWNALSLGYTEPQGHPLLRAEIAGLYSGIAPEQVLTLVPEEGVFAAMNVLLRQGDHVIVTYPGYQSLYQVAESIGCEVTHWRPDPDTWEFDIEFVMQAVRGNTRLLVMNFPHNPTGSLMPREKYAQLLRFCQERDIFVFSDEMYRFLEYDSADRLPSASELAENAISLFGMSKSFALAGLRLGWLVTRNAQLLQEITAFKDYTTICGPAPSEILALIALRAKETVLNRNLDIIRDNLKAFGQFADKYQDLVRWHKPKAGSIAFPELLKGSMSAVAEDLIAAHGVMILPASVYGYAGNNFRIGLGRKDFPEALSRLGDYFDKDTLGL